MLTRLTQEFGRYFFQTRDARTSLGFGLLGSFFGGRKEISQIIENLVYLSSLPRSAPFAHIITDTSEDDSALVVSCADISELAKSGLLFEPGAKKVRYYVLAMQDGTATVGSLDQIYEALSLMSQFADRKKPILIHCREGVGRSAMMTALHLAHRYLLSDITVKSCIDKVAAKKLDPEAATFIPDLYRTVCKYILTKRPSCQFAIPDEETLFLASNSFGVTSVGQTRFALAINILTEIHKKIQKREPILQDRDDNYRFLADLVQTPAFKKLQHFYYNSLEASRNWISKCMRAFLLNQDGWYRQLVDSTNSTSIEPELQKVLKETLEAIKQVSARYHASIYSGQIAANREGNLMADNSETTFSINAVNQLSVSSPRPY